MTELDPTAEPMRPLSNPALTTSLAPSRPKSRFVRYIVGHGWLHLMLLTGVGIFLFPFVYMFGTSMKTDEELTDAAWFPAIPHFAPDSPRVRGAPLAARPLEAPPGKWEEALPKMRQLARAAVDAAMLPPGGDAVDVGYYRAQAAEYLVGRLASRLNPDLWAGDVSKVIAAFKAALLPDTINDALDSRLARFELRGLQIRSLDSHIYNVTPGDKIAASWKIESGDASFIPVEDAAILKYHFASSSAKPIVLRCDFDFPIAPQNLHKLMLAIKPDDSWNQIDATLDVAGEHWVSQETKYLGTTRNQSILFQPPSFDDTTDRKRIWVPMKKEGPTTEESGLSKNDAQAAVLPLSPQREPGDRVIPSLSPIPAIFRITLTPSSTAGAIFGKVERNYLRVFQSIPFWRYVANSLLIVAMSTLGALFSSAFVAYAFARLNWPGRSVAFAILLSTMMLPAQVTMIPSFMIWRALGWYNTLNPLWVPAWFGVAFFIFLMVQHMRTIPRDLEEAARIDGASVLRTWWQIILPETKPALAAIAIMISMASWNEFMGPLIYLRDQAKFPLSLGLYAMRLDAPEGGVDWTLLMSGNVLMTLPVLVIFFLFQRYFIQGLTMSGMKG